MYLKILRILTVHLYLNTVMNDCSKSSVYSTVQYDSYPTRSRMYTFALVTLQYRYNYVTPTEYEVL